MRKWPTRSHLCLGLFTIHTFVSCPQFFCLLEPIVNVSTPRSLCFSSQAELHVPLYLPKHHSKPCPKNSVFISMLLLCQPVQDLLWWPLRDIWNMLSWVLPLLGPLIFSLILTLPLSNTLFPRGSRHSSRTLPSMQINSVLFLQQAHYSHLKQEDSAIPPPLKRSWYTHSAGNW
jgi:hypothetical protein